MSNVLIESLTADIGESLALSLRQRLKRIASGLWNPDGQTRGTPAPTRDRRAPPMASRFSSRGSAQRRSAVGRVGRQPAFGPLSSRSRVHAFAIIAVVLLVALVPLGQGSAGAAPVSITVTNSSDIVNGNVSSVANLEANPGPDGISLREAILATNNDPGTYTIDFAAALTGSTIALSSDLPPLTGGGVTIDGAGVTVTEGAGFAGSCPASAAGCGFQIASSGNTVSELTVQGLAWGSSCSLHSLALSCLRM